MVRLAEGAYKDRPLYVLPLTGEGAVLGTETLWRAILVGLWKVFPEGNLTPRILLEAGKEAGAMLVAMKRVQVHKFPSAVDLFSSYLSTSGIAKVEVSLLDVKARRATLHLHSNFFSKIQHEGVSMCTFIKGMLASILSASLGSVAVVETSCSSRGDGYCTFDVQPFCG